jgi:RimJ/RimL family protein N-acetyltransferase
MGRMVRTMAHPPRSDGVVTLRAWSEADADELAACLDGDEEIGRWLDQIPQPYARADALAYVGGVDEDAFAVTDAATGRVLGSIRLRWSEPHDVAEVGYWLRSDARGRGAATRALLLVTRLALDGGAARVQLRAATDNVASRRVAENAGFSLDGVLRSAHHSARLGRRVDWAMYSLLPGEL